MKEERITGHMSREVSLHAGLLTPGRREPLVSRSRDHDPGGALVFLRPGQSRTPKLTSALCTTYSPGAHTLCCVTVTLCDPVDCSPPGSSVHGTSQARTLRRAAISSRGSF